MYASGKGWLSPVIDSIMRAARGEDAALSTLAARTFVVNEVLSQSAETIVDLHLAGHGRQPLPSDIADLDPAIQKWRALAADKQNEVPIISHR